MAGPVIAIDGPAAAGKTTVGRRLASGLGWTFLDTGVLYRALSWLARQRGVAPDDERALVALAAAMDVRVARPARDDGRDATVFVDGIDVTWAIREPAVDRIVSLVAAQPGVRAALVAPQRGAAAAGPAVVVGRDIGTAIFPDAALKIFLEASAEERARRRAADLAARGDAHEVTQVQADLERRDVLDSGRAYAPLAVAADAVGLPTEGRSVDEVVDAIIALWHDRARGAE